MIVSLFVKMDDLQKRKEGNKYSSQRNSVGEGHKKTPKRGGGFPINKKKKNKQGEEGGFVGRGKVRLDQLSRV